jgi:hypothetical protein
MSHFSEGGVRTLVMHQAYCPRRSKVMGDSDLIAISGGCPADGSGEAGEVKVRFINYSCEQWCGK